MFRNTFTFTALVGVKESEMNEYVVIGLGLGVISIVMIAVFLLCHRKRKRRRLEHPSKNKMNIITILEQLLDFSTKPNMNVINTISLFE